MSQQSEIVPQGAAGDKYRRPEPAAKQRRAFTFELVLVILVFLLLAALFGALIMGSLTSINTTNQYLPVPPTAAK